ncbi:septum formation initiator family protein [Oceanobacillus sp. 143]|uniref:Cell division protein n=1 Tax=Oceanobacillus zhaokaii TaxID=2052660 RepID=A0A345PC23_9BACI|nr:septum formation initiator family protein [Oceanobacillus zhaokaii]AXI07553.1 cell division protein [Oceanobacillus zhaokaii]QGS67775.1 septum formation initiator family protein [Oceanobacillus sp. 143]
MSSREKTVTRLDSSYMQQYDAYIERQKRKKQRLIRRLVLFSIAVVLIIGSLTAYHVKQRILHAETVKQYESLEEKIDNLDKEGAYLKEEIELLNDEEYVLDIARTNYFFSKEGELIFKIPTEDPLY